MNSNVLSKLLAIVLFIIWQLASSFNTKFSVLISSPYTIVVTTIHNFSTLLKSSIYTLSESIIGLLLSIVLTIIISSMFELIKGLKNITLNYLVVWQAIPIMALAPIMILWFGFGFISKVACVVSVTIFPMLIGFSNGLNNYNKNLKNLLITYNASKFDIFKLIQLPNGIIGFFSGLKIASSYVIGSAITGEWLGGYNGLGVVLLRSRKSYNYDLMFSSISIMLLLSILFYKFVSKLEKIVITKFRIDSQ